MVKSVPLLHNQAGYSIYQVMPMGQASLVGGSVKLHFLAISKLGIRLGQSLNYKGTISSN